MILSDEELKMIVECRYRPHAEMPRDYNFDSECGCSNLLGRRCDFALYESGELTWEQLLQNIRDEYLTREIDFSRNRRIVH